ncbi:uncharacterized protein F5Z01DRAFT_174232 [Emericellopsis atlantica]|uniref:DUF7587 domain-containing protein n=1 Tax=Emericellopsis atlantica TaxID=2614577 RepID=A0A9P8CNF8_9HYPO|nr:uncharacterized protein F5Z01DRAFT_174232 [Emericellopsis atlantica]KAG9253092.1 hypothetical protein F5Z01DRAFT_174232 [Emericellopsis atlantica]
MAELAASLGALQIDRGTCLGFADDPFQIPFCPSGNLATELDNTPRYLFRVYSRNSSGENNTQWMKSPAALENNLTDIFARDDAANVATVLNEHLRWWPKSCADPFISWTTSLLFAIQYIIYKHKTEGTELQRMHLCIVDTTMFPKGVFIRDLDLMEEFHDKVPNGQERGLQNYLNLRTKRYSPNSGAYYFGEFLSQGQTNIKTKGRSSTVTCDKIVKDELFTILPQFRVEMERDSKEARLAKAVMECRKPFYVDTEREPTRASDVGKAMTIASRFGTEWSLPVLANLLALRPRRAHDPGILGPISTLFPNELRHSFSSKNTTVAANENTPEVLQFGKIIHDIHEDYWVESIYVLSRSIEETTELARRFTANPRLTAAFRFRGNGNPAAYLYRIERGRLSLLMQSLETLSGMIQECQEGGNAI